MTVFEYGSGSSTQYFSGKVKQVYSVEHDKDWFKKVNDSLAKNCKVFYRELNNGYENAIKEVNINFDFVLVDGRNRVACIKEAVNYLDEKGVLILDNSEREEYKEGIDYMLKKGFKKIDFFGIAPGLISFGCTTVFYRSDNCLNI
jgi:precorrin-6B methylase 2